MLSLLGYISAAILTANTVVYAAEPEVVQIRIITEKEKLQNYAYEKGGDALVSIIEKENKQWNPTSQNPKSTAYGLGQFLNDTWETVGCEKSDDPYYQIDCMESYIRERYETPELALAFHEENNWY